jgi:hypothetical protein
VLRFARFCAVALAVLAAAALTAAPVPKGAKQPVAAAYIHAADGTTAGAFQKLLESEGFTVDLLAHDAVAKADLSKYGLLVVGHDTEHAKWRDAAAAVEKSGKPVLGLGEGGYAAFGMDGLRLAIGGPNGWHGNDAAVRPVDAARSPLWAAAGLTDGKAVTLYEKTNHVGIHLPNPPADVVPLGREAVSPDHYALARQGDRFVLWGFTAGPDAMTADGRKLFAAACRYTAALGRASDKK